MKHDLLINVAYELKDALEADLRVQKLKEAEKQLEKDEMVNKLNVRLKEAECAYSHMIEQNKYDQVQNGLLQAQKHLHQCKKQFDELKTVSKYHQAYREVRQLYELIQNEIFTPFNKHLCGE